MSRRAETLTWERARAKGSNLLVLVKIADWASEDGQDCFASCQALAKAVRMSERGLRYILHKLERDGEITIELNVDRRAITIGKRTIQPDWFIHVRCVSAWAEYEAEESANFASSGFRRGRRRRIAQTEKLSDSAGPLKRQTLPDNRKNHVEQSENFALHIRNDSRTDPGSDTRTPAPALDPVRESFAQVWAIYPRQEGERQAFVVWALLSPAPALVAQILAAVARQKLLPQWQDVQYVPLLRTYLEHARWLDQAPDRPTVPLGAKELDHARLVRNRRFGCTHDPRCASVDACVRAIAYEIRDRQPAAS